MTQEEYISLAASQNVLKEIQKEYPGKTIDNIIQQIGERLKHSGHTCCSYPTTYKNCYRFECWIHDRSELPDGSGRRITLEIKNRSNTARTLMVFDQTYDPVAKEPVCGYIREFSVEEEVRQKGIGSEMLRRLENQAREIGVHILLIENEIKPTSGSWADEWLSGKGYHSDTPGDTRLYHYQMMYKRLVDSY